MPEPTPPPTHTSDAGAPARAGFLRVLGAVFASFVGIRKRSAGEHDIAHIKLPHIIAAALVGAAIFVAVLVALVMIITRRG
jgi:ABC-type Fe3+-siderophore transport system permease subunit